MRGILLAGGAGTRLHPLTTALSKQLMPVYDKPLVYYPLSVLMLAGIREVLLVATPRDLPAFRRLLGDGTRLGMRIGYAEQVEPEGIAAAFALGRGFLAGGPACLILGDNLFFGGGLVEHLRAGARLTQGGLVFAYRVTDPQRYGVVTFAADGTPADLVEKPERPPSPYAVPGLYFYGGEVCAEVDRVVAGPGGERGITDLNRALLAAGRLAVRRLGRGIAWLDTGTHDSLHDAASYVRAVQNRQGLMIACLEEIAWRNGWIGRDEVRSAADAMGSSSYAGYLQRLVQEGIG